MNSLSEKRIHSEQRWEGYDSWLGRYGLVRIYPLRLPFRSLTSQASAVFVFSDISEEHILKEAMARRNELLSFLHTISRSYPSGYSIDRTLKELFAFAQGVIGFDSLLFFSLSEKREVEVIFYHQGEFLPLEKIEPFAGAQELYYTFQNHPQGLPQGEFSQKGVSLYGALLGEKGDLGYLTLARSKPWSPEDLELVRIFSSGVEGLLMGVKLERERIQRQALEVANLFTNQSAHEVRNYLTSLNFFLELLKEENLAPEIREFIRRLINQGNKVHRLISDMLSLTRPVREERFECFDLCRFLREIAGVWEEIHPGTRIELSLPEEGAWQVKGDRLRLEEAIYNLLKNALEASPPGSPVRISLRHSSNGREAVITIEDEGSGIPPEVLPHLFTPLFHHEDRRERSGAYDRQTDRRGARGEILPRQPPRRKRGGGYPVPSP